MNKKEKLLTIQTIRLSNEMVDDLRKAGNNLDASIQEVMRLSMKIGLQHLENINYDLAKAVIHTSQDNNINISNSDSPVIAIGSKNTKTKVKTKK